MSSAEIDAIQQFPHCDALVLHEPQKCESCDRHPDWQQLRQMWGVNFTGVHDPSKAICPAERRRPLETLERWHGNIVPNSVPGCRCFYCAARKP